MNVLNTIHVTNAHLNGIMYNGSEKKFGITIDGVNYIMKFRKRDWNNLESEYIASNVIKIFWGNVHDVYLGEYKGERVVLCRDFTQHIENSQLLSLRSISSSKFDTTWANYDYYFTDVLHLFETLNNCDVNQCADAFCYMFCFDALLGNTDRHAGNWGLIKDKGVWRFSPIFDNGASLFPRASITDVDEDWVRERVYIWPNSKVMFNKERERASYYLILKENPKLQNYLHLFTDDKLEVAFVFIDATCISDDLKHLYKTMLYYRYNCIVKQKPFIWEGVL